jgi:hypothetical protein
MLLPDPKEIRRETDVDDRSLVSFDGSPEPGTRELFWNFQLYTVD